MCFIVLLLHAGSEGLTMCRRRIEGGKKKKSSAVAPIPNDLTGLRSLPSIWGNGFSLDRTGREPARLAVVEGDQKTRGVRADASVSYSQRSSPLGRTQVCVASAGKSGPSALLYLFFVCACVACV